MVMGVEEKEKGFGPPLFFGLIMLLVSILEAKF